jgi:hypothetical protein
VIIRLIEPYSSPPKGGHISIAHFKSLGIKLVALCQRVTQMGSKGSSNTSYHNV